MAHTQTHTHIYVDPNSIGIGLARLALLILMGLSYPIQFHPGRMYVDGIFFAGKPPDWHPEWRHSGLSAAIIITTFTIAFFVRDLELVLSLVGATGSTLMVYLLPGLFYFLAFRRYTLMQDKWRIVALFMAILGCFIVVVCVTFIILNQFLF